MAAKRSAKRSKTARRPTAARPEAAVPQQTAAETSDTVADCGTPGPIVVGEELLKSRDRIRAIVDTAVDGIITIDEQGTIESFNPAAERVFGYAAAEIVGQDVTILMPLPYRDEHDAYLNRYLRTGEKRIIGIGREVRGRRKDGSTFPMDLAHVWGEVT